MSVFVAFEPTLTPCKLDCDVAHLSTRIQCSIVMAVLVACHNQAISFCLLSGTGNVRW